MDYMKHYYDLCLSRSEIDRQKGNGDYFESHHIFPTSIYQGKAGTDRDTVLLTAREHYMVHWLIWKGYESIYGKDDWRTIKMARSFWRTCNGNPEVRERSQSSRAYEISKRAMIESQTGKPLDPDNLSLLKGEDRTEAQKLVLLNRSHAPESRVRLTGDNRSEAQIEAQEKNSGTNNTYFKQSILGCEHCSKEFRLSHYRQWHGDNCKLARRVVLSHV